MNGEFMHQHIYKSNTTLVASDGGIELATIQGARHILLDYTAKFLFITVDLTHKHLQYATNNDADLTALGTSSPFWHNSIEETSSPPSSP